MGTRLDFEKDRRNRLPRDAAADCPGLISEELEHAARLAVRKDYVRRSDASEELRMLRRELFQAVQVASSEAFMQLCQPEAKRLHSYHLTKVAPVLRRLDEIPNKLLFGYSNARIADADNLIAAARTLAARFEKRIQEVRKHYKHHSGYGQLVRS